MSLSIEDVSPEAFRAFDRSAYLERRRAHGELPPDIDPERGWWACDWPERPPSWGLVAYGAGCERCMIGALAHAEIMGWESAAVAARDEYGRITNISLGEAIETSLRQSGIVLPREAARRRDDRARSEMFHVEHLSEGDHRGDYSRS